MKWVTYDAGEGPRAGLLPGDDTVRGLPAELSLLSLLGDDGVTLADAATAAHRRPAEVRPLEEVRLLAPIPRPPSVRDALCFLEHLRGCYRAMGRSPELPAAFVQTPAFYFANPAAVVGPHDDVAVAPGCTLFDFELEVGLVVGRAGRDLHPNTALEHLVGVTLYNDWTARDHQQRDMAQGIGMGKSKDSAITLGPALLTTDELAAAPDGHLPLEVSAAVNGKEIARGSLAAMDWSPGELLAYLSRGTELRPGDVIGSGTVPGGCLLEHVDTPSMADYQGWLQPGDVVSLSAEGIGETSQVVRPAEPMHPLSSGY